MPRKCEYGDYQTTPAFAKQVCTFLKNRYTLNPAVVIEPTCGVGAFVKASLIFNAPLIYGIELTPEYCEICSREIAASRIQVINADIFSFTLGELKELGGSDGHRSLIATVATATKTH